jgi:hypothetical protein
MMIATLEAEDTAMLETIQPNIRKECVNNESQNKHQSWLQPATRSAGTPVIKKGLPQRVGEVLSLARPLSYRAPSKSPAFFLPQ